MVEFPLPEFCGEPTADGDISAAWLRQWYEANRESWWDRHRPSADRNGVHADEWMLAFMEQFDRLQNARAAFIQRQRGLMGKAC